MIRAMTGCAAENLDLANSCVMVIGVASAAAVPENHVFSEGCVIVNER